MNLPAMQAKVLQWYEKEVRPEIPALIMQTLEGHARNKYCALANTDKEGNSVPINGVCILFVPGVLLPALKSFLSVLMGDPISHNTRRQRLPKPDEN